MARFLSHPSRRWAAAIYYPERKIGRTLSALPLLQPSAAGSRGRSASRRQPDGGSGAAIEWLVPILSALQGCTSVSSSRRYPSIWFSDSRA